MEFNNLFSTSKAKDFTKEEREALIKYYRSMITMLDAFQKDPKQISVFIQGCYECVKELQDANAKEEKESTETTNKETKS